MGKGLLSFSLWVALLSLALASDDGSWFDMQKCEMCKPLMEEQGLMNHMTWEHHNISSGLVSITKVDRDYLDSYKTARAKMNAVSQKMMKGEPVYLCNMCKSMGAIMQSGASTDMVQSGNTFVWVTSSGDPEVVKKIHAWTDRTNREMQAIGEGEHETH